MPPRIWIQHRRVKICWCPHSQIFDNESCRHTWFRVQRCHRRTSFSDINENNISIVNKWWTILLLLWLSMRKLKWILKVDTREMLIASWHVQCVRRHATVISRSQSALKLLSLSDVQGKSDSKLKCYSCGCMYSGSWICWADDGHNQKARSLVRIALSILHLSSQYLERRLQTCRKVIVLGGEELSSIIGFCERLLGCLGRIYSGNPNYVKQVESEYEMDELSSCKQAWDNGNRRRGFVHADSDQTAFYVDDIAEDVQCRIARGIVIFRMFTNGF